MTTIQEIVPVDMIYVLGAASNCLQYEGVFAAGETQSQNLSHLHLLVLGRDNGGKECFRWQDQIEQACFTILPVTAIILETHTFNNWREKGHLFARKVVEQGKLFFSEGSLEGSLMGKSDQETEKKMLDKQYQDGLNKVREFLAGADLYRIRRQNRMAAFMLHQSVEQALSTILKTHTGYYCCSHNLERLIRLTGMVTGLTEKVFPKNSDPEKKLFSLLQRAYIESRYGEEYVIHFTELMMLTDKAREMQKILEDLHI